MKILLNIKLIISFLITAIAIHDLFFISPVIALPSKYEIIIKNNPFDPKRGEGAKFDKSNGQIATDNELQEKYVIYGTLIVGDKKIAYLKKLKDKDKDFRKVTVNDLVEGWTVKEINDNGIIFEKGNEKFMMPVFDNKKSERRSTKPVAFATPKAKTVKNIKKTTNTSKNSSRHKNRKKTKVFKFPQNVNEKTEQNPFLKAILDAQKKASK